MFNQKPKAHPVLLQILTVSKFKRLNYRAKQPAENNC